MRLEARSSRPWGCGGLSVSSLIIASSAGRTCISETWSVDTALLFLQVESRHCLFPSSVWDEILSCYYLYPFLLFSAGPHSSFPLVHRRWKWCIACCQLLSCGTGMTIMTMLWLVSRALGRLSWVSDKYSIGQSEVCIYMCLLLPQFTHTCTASTQLISSRICFLKGFLIFMNHCI